LPQQSFAEETPLGVDPGAQWEEVEIERNESFPAALRAVHLTALNVMQTSSKMLETSGPYPPCFLFDPPLKGLFDNKDEDEHPLVDDDGMEEEE
ncbi:unnamed protein product, partial [Choristocarpus tenellus]